MTPIAPLARAEAAPDERSPTRPATDSPRAESPAAGATALPGVPLLGPLEVRLADKNDVPGQGRPVVVGMFVGLELAPAQGRHLGGQFQHGQRVGGELNDAAAAGKQLVEVEVAAAVDGDGPVAALKSREARLKASLAQYTAEQRTAERDRDEARQAVRRAIADGSDPGPFETREVAALDAIRQLEQRLAGTRDAMTSCAADIARTTANVGRAVRARIGLLAEQRLLVLSSEVADALFVRLTEIVRDRSAVNAARD